MDNNVAKLGTGNAAAGLIAGEEHGRRVAELTAAIKTEQDGRPYRIAGNGAIETVERLCAQPTFRRGQVNFNEALSFARFVKRFANSTTVLFADAPNKTFTAILDYHPSGEDQTAAQWDLFRGVVQLRHTESWETWEAANKEPMTQAEFAQFLEDNIPDIAEPAGAKLVEIARSLEAKVDVNYSSHIREDDGSHRFNYSETVNGSSAGGVTIPAEIGLVLQPFEGSKTYRIQARFRYRVTGKQVSMWFDLVRMQDVLRQAFDDELVKIQAEIGGQPIYNGPAPAAQQPKD